MAPNSKTKEQKRKERKAMLDSCMRVLQDKVQLHQRMVTIVMNGLPLAGKTTTKERILGHILQRLKEVSPGTRVVEPTLKVTITELLRSSAMLSGNQWALLSLDEESLHLATAVLQAAGSLKSKSHISSVISSITRALRGTSTDPISLSSSSEVSAANVSITRPDQLFNALLIKHWNKLNTSLEDATTIRFIDAGGQPEFQEILPALLSGHSISIFLFKLHEELKQRYQVEYVIEDCTKSEPYMTSYTVEEVLFQSLATVACYGSGTTNTDPTHHNSVALLVGTYKDLATEDGIKAAEESLKQKVESAEYFKRDMIHYPFPGQLIFPIDNTQDEDVQKLRKVLEDIIHKRFPRLSLPASWLALEFALRNAGVKILTLKDCQKIAKLYGITSKKELKKALLFFHDMCMVRYYPDVEDMKDLIICDIQILFDAIINLIVQTFTFTKAGEAGKQKFKKTGRFSLQELERLATPKCSNDLSPKKLVKLLEYLHILVPIHEAGCDEYFMPCVLQTADLDDVAVHPLPYPSLIISFECGYCPVGAFSALVVYFLQHSQEEGSALDWKIPNGATVYRNKISFRVGHNLNKVTMIARPTYFEVQYDCLANQLHTPVHTVCSLICKDILDGLAVVIRSRNYTCKTTPLIGFYCPRPQCTPTPHIAICKGENPLAMECISSNEPMELHPIHFIWFGKDQTTCSIPGQQQQTVLIPSPCLEEENSSSLQDSSALGERPTIIELIRFRGRSRRINILQEISTKYYDFGVLLLKDGTGAKLRNVIHKYKHDAEQINQEILEQWIDGKGKQPVTWGTLVKVLRDVKLTTLASDIENALL